ncbi:(2Fe-2S)-binding protein [Halobacillus sp. Marseille-P3879]|uniref:(2Fe-2S)-binding protein n=1 Tax=Halobacillus sp. Marseille-P3879 TaxID=2045014 RepID=UPI000C79DA9A|nr:(2Fe-2S)-binding protein [Halobacillus sp. Marseille-P3879]
MNKDELIICRCEEVNYQTLRDTAHKYQCTSRELKLRTRAGMGYCGGRSCRLMVDKIANSNEGEQDLTYISLKYQPPVRPIKFEDLGGDKN